LKKRGWELGQSTHNPGGAYIGWGVGDIKLEPDDVKYAQARIMAFYRAFTEAKGDFILYQQQNISTKLVREFFYDDFPEIEKELEDKEYWKERIDTFVEKAIDLGEAKLDALLKEFDVDLDNYTNANKIEKKKILHDAISQTTVIRALGSLAGVRVLANFEDLNSVGVLIIHNEQSETIARQIAHGDVISRNTSDVVKKTILEQLGDSFTNIEKYIPVYGVRVMEDETGEKVLVSFGQWAPAITNNTNTTISEARVKAARKIAQSNAIADLTNFINSTLVLESHIKIQESEDVNRIRMVERLEEIESYQIGEYSENIIKQYGNVQLQGITTIEKWSANDPNTGHVIVGHVAMWSPATRDAALGIITVQEEMPEGEIEYDEGVRESPALDHLDPTLQP
jgi:soluble P-type ATPase